LYIKIVFYSVNDKKVFAIIIQ